MNIAVVLLAAAFLVIAVLLAYELYKLKEKSETRQKTVKPVRKKAKASGTGHVQSSPEEESKEALNILKIQDSLFDEDTEPESVSYKTALPKEFDDLLQQEKKTAEEKKKENENLFPNAHVHQEPSIAREAVSTSAVDQVVNQMMDDIMKSLETSTGTAAENAAQKEEDETPLRQLMKASMQKEEKPASGITALDQDLLSQIEAVNSNAQSVQAGSEEDSEEPVTMQQIQQLIEENVQQESAAEEELHVIPADAGLMEQIEAVNQAAEENRRGTETEEAEIPAFAQTPAEEVQEEDSKAETDGLPLAEIPLKYSIFSQWKGKCGEGEPVLFIFRRKIYYDVFLDTIGRMFEKELYPAYPFFVCFCDDRNREDRAVDEISSWFFENHCETSRILCDTVDRYPVHDGVCCYGAGTGTLLDLKFGSMSELGKAEIVRIVEKAEKSGVQCAAEESGLHMLAADNDSAEAVLAEIEEVGEHYNFGVHISAQQNASDICSASSTFVRMVSSAIKRTFRDRKTEAVVMPATEWNGSLRGYEAIWFAPSASRAVSFYLNLLCLG